MQTISINIVNKSNNPLPSYATEGAAGMDIRAAITEPVVLQPLERSLIPTGLFIELPEGYEAQIRPRSGMALKQGITCLNSPGTVDSDYRGELKVILINLSNTKQEINNGDRIAQMVIAKTEKATFCLKEQLSDTVRGEGGFGHTGIQ
jgi:dUTP pyrophosphatase